MTTDSATISSATDSATDSTSVGGASEQPAAATRVPATGITLHRAEGPIHRVQDATFTGHDVFDQAADTLRSWSFSAPKDGSVDKTDFTVTYADGTAYQGCYGLEYDTDGSLTTHMRRHLSFLVEHPRELGAESAQEAQTFLDTYALTD